MNIFKIAIALAAACSVADTYSKGRDIVLQSDANAGGLHAIYKRRSCLETGFHPASLPAPPVTVDLVKRDTPNVSVSCYEPGEEHNVIIKSSSYITGILIMPLKDGLTMYSKDLVSVGTMRCPRLDRRLFMDSICSDQSVSHKSNFKLKKLSTLTIPWDAPNSTDACPVVFIYHVFYSYGTWLLGKTMPFPVCNETKNETMVSTSTGDESNSESEAGTKSGTESETESSSGLDPESGSRPNESPNSNAEPSSLTSTPTTMPTKPPTDKTGQ